VRDDIPPRSYGPLIETTVQVVTWNVWGRYGPWPERETAIIATLRDAEPDIVVLTESWAKEGDSQWARLAGPLGLPHHAFSGVTAEEDAAALSGVGILSRWPIRDQAELTFGSARVQFAEVAGPRGPIQVYGLVMDAWWFDQSQARQDAVRSLLTYAHQHQDPQTPGARPRPRPGCRATTPGRWRGRPDPATPGPTPTRGRPSCCGRTAGSTTSSRPPPGAAGPAIPGRPRC
jgi:hypothetical protein